MSEEKDLARLVSDFKSIICKVNEEDMKSVKKSDFTNFKLNERKYIVDRYKKSLAGLKGLMDSPETPNRISEIISGLTEKDIEKNKEIISELEKYKNVHMKQKSFQININKIPDEIKNEIRADLDEMQKCFENGCYRSCVILCGRIIEVGLHAKYYKITGFDILDKNPGIGLGKLIAKMQEKNIKLDPGLTQQIHLVNNVRIFSVHKKQRTFIPSKQQTEAIILYTTDVIAHLF